MARYFYLSDADHALIAQHRGFHNRLGFAVQLCTVRFLGTFLPDPGEVPNGVANYLAAQLGLAPPDLNAYSAGQSHWRHSREIREHFGYREFGSHPEGFRLVRWLYARAWLGSERPSVLFDMATNWLVEHKILLPGATVLERVVARVRDRAADRLWKTLAAIPNQEQRHRLEALLQSPAGTRQSTLDRLRRAPVRVSAPSLIGALRRWKAIRDVGVGDLNVTSVPPTKLRTLARYAAKAWVGNLARMPDDRRVATLLALVKALELGAMDDALEVLDLLLTDRLKRAKRGREEERLRTLPQLDQAARLLWEACAVILDDNCEDVRVRPEVFERIPRSLLEQAFYQVSFLAKPADEHSNEELLRSYRGIRRFLPTVLRLLTFQCSQEGQAAVDAFEFLKRCEDGKEIDFDNAPMEGMSKSWQRLVLNNHGHVDRRAYTLYAVQRLHESLRRRDVFVERSGRWGDPRAKLLQGEAWEAARPQILRSLALDRDPLVELEKLRYQLDDAYSLAESSLPRNEALRIEREHGLDSLVLSRLEQLEEPPSLLRLRSQVKELLPEVDLPEVLLEIQTRTRFLDEFTHISESTARVQDLEVSLCAVLLAEACNIGLEPLVRPEVPALTRGRLSWVQQNYVRADTLIRANAKLVEAQTRIPLAWQWGGGEVASADGLRFIVPVRTVNAGPNPRYFGIGKGITYYNFTSDQFTGFHSIVVPGTLRDSLVILDGLLEQQTVLEPQEIMTDTAGSSDLVFGLFWLLGYQFSPRLADIGGLRFWRFDFSQHYGPLNCLSRHLIDRRRIERNWEDVLRVAGSLKMGTVSASDLTRSLLRSERPSALARAISELGKIPKTIHLLNYIRDEAYRRRILTQLNRTESRHKWAREVCHGQRGQIRKRYREGQEDQLNTLGLVVNAMVLWNTLYMDQALQHLKAAGQETQVSDIARLSPLEHRTINLLGRYSFTLPDEIARGAMRPLRQPDELAQVGAAQAYR